MDNEENFYKKLPDFLREADRFEEYFSACSTMLQFRQMSQEQLLETIDTLYISWLATREHCRTLVKQSLPPPHPMMQQFVE